VKYCCLFLFVLILEIEIHKGWDRSFKKEEHSLTKQINIYLFKRLPSQSGDILLLVRTDILFVRLHLRYLRKYKLNTHLLLAMY